MFKRDDFPDNINKLYGYIEPAKDSNKFKIINNLNVEEDAGGPIKIVTKKGATNLKFVKKGAVCGSGSDAKNKGELRQIINYLYDPSGVLQKYDSLSSMNMTNKVSNTYIVTVEINKVNINSKSMCQEIELLLRHNELINNTVNKNLRFFYKFEEKQYIEQMKK